MSFRKLLALFCVLTFAISVVSICIAQQPSASNEEEVDLQKFCDSWTGSLDVGAVRLRLVFNLTMSGGKILATLDSPDQGAKGIPLDEVALDGRTINIASKKMKAVFVGKLNDPNNQIEGTWSQGGRDFPLVLQRVEGTPERLRPQTPRPPYSYQVEEVSYPHQTGKFNLAGTLTIPKTEELSPAVILVSGSGAQDRDETIFEHKRSCPKCEN